MDVVSYILAKNKGGGGSSSSVSWNNVKDKPFSESTGEIVIVPYEERRIQTVFGMGGEVPLISFSITPNFELGKTYSVTIEGVTQELVCFAFEDFDGFSTLVFNDPEYGNIEICDVPLDEGYVLVAIHTGRSYSVSIGITTIGTKIDTLDPKFLPSSVTMKYVLPKQFESEEELRTAYQEIIDGNYSFILVYDPNVRRYVEFMNLGYFTDAKNAWIGLQNAGSIYSMYCNDKTYPLSSFDAMEYNHHLVGEYDVNFLIDEKLKTIINGNEVEY